MNTEKILKKKMDMRDTDTYRRLLRVPTFLSLALYFATINLLVYTWVANIPSKWVWVISSIPAGLFIGYFSLFVRRLAYDIMVKERVWQWGRTRFDSWGELDKFMAETPAFEINRLMGEDD